jgi:type 2 lantibiotic biosynthesis protein LanM
MALPILPNFRVITDAKAFKDALKLAFNQDSIEAKSAREKFKNMSAFQKNNDALDAKYIERYGVYSFGALPVPFIEIVAKHLSFDTKSILRKYPNLTENIDIDLLTESFMREATKRCVRILEKVIVKESDSYNVAIKKNSFTQFRKYLSKKYPVLENLLTQTVQQLYSFYLEVIEKYLQDFTQLQGIFSISDSLKSIELLGDIHHGKAVCQLTFSQHQKLIFKPQYSGVYQLFDKVCAFVNHNGATHQLITPKSVLQGTYGWFEFIENKPLDSLKDASIYYHRLGAYQFLLYILNGMDFHFENIIASGSSPYLIDLECLMQNMSYLPTDAYNEILQSSVLPTGLLPTDFGLGKDTKFKIGGGSYLKGQETSVKNKMLVKDAKGNLVIEEKPYIMDIDSNIPMFDDVPQLIEDYQINFRQGFEEIYQIVLAQKEDFQSIIEVCAKEDLFLRILIRPTPSYSHLLKLSLETDNFTYPQKREMLFNTLWFGSKSRPYADVFVHYEIDDMLQNSIPMFHLKANTRSLYHTGEAIVDNFFRESALEQVLNKVGRMSQKDCVFQSTLIQQSLDKTYKISVTKNTLQETIHQIETQIDKQSVWQGDSLHFIDFQLNTKDEFYLGELPAILFSGYAGLLLTYTYLATSFEGKNYKKNAFGIFRNLEKNIDKLIDNQSLGIYCGVGGIVYALCHFYKIFQEEKSLILAQKIVKKLEIDIKNEPCSDIFYGTCGYLTVLGKLYEITKEEAILDKIQEYSWTVFEQLDDFYSQGKYGFAHGFSGVLYSLICNYNLLPEGLQKKIIFAFSVFEKDLEKQYFMPQVENGKKSAWCHSEVGIGLMYLKSVDILERKPNKNLVNQLVNVSIQKGWGHNDSLCHGDGSVLELLIESEKYNISYGIIREKYFLKFCNNLINNGLRGGTRDFVHTLGFMAGASGTVYTLLRNYSKEVPSMLMLD